MNAPAALASALTLSLLAAPALAQQKTVEVSGVAAVVNGDLGMARDKAIDDAKRKAVEQVAGTRVSSESIMENYQLVEDRIYARASGFVKTYELLTEFKDGDTYHVKLKATVDAGRVADDLDQLFKVKPRVIVLIAEQNVGASSFSYWWGKKGFSSEMDIMQSTLISDWSPFGFKFVDPGLLSGKLKVTRALRKPELSNDDALSIARGVDADVAIVGKVVVTDAGPVMDGVKMRSFHAVGALRVINLDSGEIIAVKDEAGVAPHIDGNQGGRQAIKVLAKKLGEGLRSSIMKRWTAEAVGAKELEVELLGVSPKFLKEIRQFMKNQVRGVERVDERRRKRGAAYWTVHFRGKAMELGQALENHRFDGFGLEVVELSKARLVVEKSK